MFSERKSKTYLRVFGDFLCSKMSDQRICLKYCVKNRIKFSEAFKMLKEAFDDDAMSLSRVYEWYKCFREGREDVKDDAMPGRPSTSITDDNVELFITNSYHQAVPSINSKSTSSWHRAPVVGTPSNLL